MDKKDYLQYLKGDDEFQKIEIEVRDPENEFIEMLQRIGGAANVGHSFYVVVDPELESESKKFSIDGDGSFYMKSIKLNGRKL